LGLGLIGGAAGLLVMEAVRRATAPLISERAPKPTDVFLSERSISPFGPQHRPDEGATDALGRIAYERVTGYEPSPEMKRALSWAVHIAYGLAVAAVYGAVRRGHTRRLLRDGALFGLGLWLFGDELASPLLGLSDKPTAYSPTRHLQSLAQHLGFGVTTAATTRALEGFR
jgi:uncharacterized membrane protein YagU involved in acid resistance